MAGKIKIRIIFRTCAVCGKTITVLLDAKTGKILKGGHYSGDVDGREYWECESCFGEKELQ